MKIVLIAGSRRDFADGLRAELTRKGFTVAIASGLEAALETAAAKGASAVVADGADPGLDWAELARRVAESRSLERVSVFAIVPEANLARIDPRMGLSDFALDGAGPEEVAARLDLLLWRERKASAEGLLTAGGVDLDTERFEVRVRGRAAELTYQEYELLRFLMSHPGRVFSRTELLSSVWRYDYFGGTRTVDVHVRRLRSKLEGEAGLIETVRGVGYRLREG
jgi:DNA-binding response OmpR family regulator